MEGDIITMQDIFVFEQDRPVAERQGRRPIPRHRHPAEVQRTSWRRPASTLPVDMFEHMKVVA